MRTLFIIVESFQKVQQFFLISPQDNFNLWWLLGICDEYLETRKNEYGVFLLKLQVKGSPTLNTWNASN